jgi:hypothetical protein
MGETCSTHEREAYTRCLSENLKGRVHLGDIDADERI